MTKVAILIDGGYFLKRLPTVRPDIDTGNPEDVDRSIGQLLWSHLSQLNRIYGTWDYTRKGGIEEPQGIETSHASNPFRLLYRCFYYDAPPYKEKAHTPIDKRPIDYAKTDRRFSGSGFSESCAAGGISRFDWARFARIETDPGF